MSQSRKEQPYDYYIIIDFEANCKRDDEVFQKEIIEFPLIIIDSTTNMIEEKYHTFVKPWINPEITSFCELLTGVSQENVKNAPDLGEAIELVDAFLKDHGYGTKPFMIVCDGPWDMFHFLHDECVLKNIKKPAYYDSWVNIRSLFQTFYRRKSRCGIEKMLSHLKLKFEGNPHSGMDDSINIARIAMRMMDDGCILESNQNISEFLE